MSCINRNSLKLTGSVSLYKRERVKIVFDVRNVMVINKVLLCDTHGNREWYRAQASLNSI